MLSTWHSRWSSRSLFPPELWGIYSASHPIIPGWGKSTLRITGPAIKDRCKEGTENLSFFFIPSGHVSQYPVNDGDSP